MKIRDSRKNSLIAHPTLLPSIYYLTVEHKSPSPSSIVFASDLTSDYKMLFVPIKMRIRWKSYYLLQDK